MNQQELATCHCIISHPSKPKFLTVRHSDNWSPPIVRFPPEGGLVAKAKLITDGVMNKYGFKTTVLRHLKSSPKYHCIELEMQSAKSPKKLQAVWVGSKEYAKYRRSSRRQFDPFAAWLKEQEAGRIPELRPPWEQKAWFDSASLWLHHQLNRLNIQTTGSVEQFRAFRTASSILRVPTSQGMVYFKASFNHPPLEAPLTKALAQRWPGHVPAPLAIDEKRNWMLSMDYGNRDGHRLQFSDYPSIARVLAQIQRESLDSMAQWQELACPVQELEQLSGFIAGFDRLAGVLSEGGGIALSTEEIDRLGRMSDRLQACCSSLAEFSIPNMLVHPDVWFANLHFRDDGWLITDWSGTVISHPFLSVLKLIRFRELWSSQADDLNGPLPPNAPTLAIGKEGDEKLTTAILDAYLERFEEFESKDRLNEAMALARELEGAWRLFKWQQAIAHEEYESVGYQKIARFLQRISREMITRNGN
jgi:hypothetical protein